MNAITKIQAAPDFEAIKTKQNAAWASGDYGKIGVTLQKVGEDLAERMDLTVGASVLDVAAGNGNATLAFARRGATVTSTDYVEKLLIQGSYRAAAEGLKIDFQIADAEALPFADNSFDATVSTFGVMFAPNQYQAASELIRVTKSSGSVGLANWTPDSFIGALFKTIGRNVPPPAGVNSPALWGQEEWFTTTFAPHASSVTATMKDFVFRYRSVDEFIEIFAAFYGPVHKAFLALDAAGQMKLRDEITETVASYNVATDGSMRVPSEYAEIVIAKS